MLNTEISEILAALSEFCRLTGEMERGLIRRVITSANLRTSYLERC